MSKDTQMQDEYDFSNGVRGKYASSFQEGTNIIKIDSDIKKNFQTLKQ